MTKAKLLTSTALVGIGLALAPVAARAQTPTVVTVSQSGAACTSNPVDFTDFGAALISIKDDYSRLYDVQLCPSTTAYATAGTAAFNGLLEGVGTLPDDVLISLNCQGCQYYLGIGDINSPYPGVTMTVKNLHIDGTTTNSKTGRCVQVISGGAVLFDDVDITNCQDGILADAWTLTDGSGEIVISGSTFDHNCSGSGPSHSIYLNTGTVVVGPPAGPVAGIAPAAGEVNFAGSVIAVAPNSFGECALGYNVKLRTVHGIVDGNNFDMNFVDSSSGAIDDSDGGTMEAINNAMTFGPTTGQGESGSTTPPQAILLGGLLGKNLPESHIINNNTMVLSGVTVPFIPISSIDNDPNVFVAGNTLPLQNQLANGQIIKGQGTIQAGNTYADGTAVTPVVQDTFFDGDDLTPTQDFRGTSGPQSGSLTATEHTMWGGNGLLTATGNFAGSANDAFIGGPGGMNLTSNGNDTWAWTDPASIANSLSLGVAQVFSFGQNDTLNSTYCHDESYIDAFGGTLTVSFNGSTLLNPECELHAYKGATVTAAAIDSSGKNGGLQWLVHPGGKIISSGVDADPLYRMEDGTAVINNLTIQPSGSAGMTFNLTATGGSMTMGPKVTASGGVITAVSGWTITSYEGAADSPTITLADTTPLPYSIDGAGGATVYAAVDQVALTGGARSSGPTARLIALHAQGGTSTASANFAPMDLYLDGPGTVDGSRANTSTAPISVEFDVNGSGSIEITNPGSVVSCTTNGVTIASAGTVGANYVITSSAGGTLQLDGLKTGPTCQPVNNTLTYTPAGSLTAMVPPGTTVGTISGGTPPYSSSDATDFSITGSNLVTAGTLGAGGYPTTITDSGH